MAVWRICYCGEGTVGMMAALASMVIILKCGNLENQAGYAYRDNNDLPMEYIVFNPSLVSLHAQVKE